jgi:hypothetical protein
MFGKENALISNFGGNPMGKNKGVDFVEDLYERANHNMKPHYWINRVTPFTMAQWRANKYFAPMFFVIYTSIGILWIYAFNEAARLEHKSFWGFLFDFHDSSTTARFIGILIFFAGWVITGIGTAQSILQRVYAPPSTPQPERRKEKKKKYPKRPKNYK